MPFYADLHVHSKYSRATSRDCDLEHLALWAAKKGIAVVGTGDFTHPAWLDEIRDKLIPAEPGLFRLRDEVVRPLAQGRGPTRPHSTCFMLTVEISTIYKHDDRTRKVHHLICVPDLESAERLVTRLERVGNIASDGRPILGLDSRDLLEIVLESGPGSYLVPAHIWTPWFSVLGSKSGFDSVEACYRDLADHIFAVETGLSSDPPMNWRLSALDRYRLISNSDAHSPAKLGREACVFTGDLDYYSMRGALETGDGYGGTVEFFPEEGKYHLDGHRKCEVRLTPEETRAHGGLCPVCQKPVTVGVMHRVEALADRQVDEIDEPLSSYRCLIPLVEVIGEIERVGPGSKRVAQIYEGLLARLGPELAVLEQLPVDEIERRASPLLAEAIARMRRGDVIRDAGYDGEYGTIHLFSQQELPKKRASGLLFALEPHSGRATATPGGVRALRNAAPATGESHSARRPQARPHLRLDSAAARAEREPSSPHLAALDAEQRTAAQVVEGPLLIIAGPGTGKTRTLTHRIAHLVGHRGVRPESCLTITFSRRAAEELRGRIAALLGDVAPRVPIHTFHSLGLLIVREQRERFGLPAGFTVASAQEQQVVLAEAAGLSAKEAKKRREQISTLKRTRATPPPEIAESFDAYHHALRARGLVDFDDLLTLPLALFDLEPDLVAHYRELFRYVSIDEYQDIDALQYALVRQLLPDNGNVCAIGDPDQAIYGFRGADVAFFRRFEKDFPSARVVRLARSYRVGQSILEASSQVIAGSPNAEARLASLLDDPGAIVMHAAATERAEAEYAVATLEGLLGGHSFFSLDSGRSGGDGASGLAFGDIAILYRTEAQADALVEALARSGLPFQRRSHHPLGDRPAVRTLVAAMEDLEAGEPAIDRLHAAMRVLSVPDDQHAAVLEPELAAALALLEPVARRCGSDVVRFFDEIRLGAEVDLWDRRAERISLLTLHAAKGLEFSVVFVIGCEDGLLPLRFGGELEEEALAEERRLFYVGLTRARHRVFLTRAGRRRWRGKLRELPPSPFLRDIAERLFERQAASPRAKRKPKKQPQLELF